MVKVLFVCMGNICRSPTAEGIFTGLLRQHGLEQHVFVDSAGTHAYHIGSAPDTRARNAAAKRGADIGSQRARKIAPADFETFDYILAMDRDNLEILEELCPPELRDKLHLMLRFAPEIGIDEVPDPYYGGAAGFERVLDLIEAAAEGLLNEIREKVAR
jgi:protein-tyrosine phosphatase